MTGHDDLWTERLRAAVEDHPAATAFDPAAYIAAGRRHRARRTLGVAAAAAAVVALVVGVAGYLGAGDRAQTPRPIQAPTTAPAPEIDPADWALPQPLFLAGVVPEPADLVGLWRVRTSSDTWLMLLGGDGYWATTNGWSLYDASTAGNRGRYTLDRGTLVEHGRQGFCGAGWVAGHQVVLAADGSLHLFVRPDDVGVRPVGGVCKPAAGDRMIWDRVAPGSSRLLDSLPPDDATSLDARAADRLLPGVWVGTDGRWVVTVDPDHRFRAFRDSGDPSAEPDDTGLVSVDDQGRLTMTCRGGEAAGDVTLGVTAEVPGLLSPTVRMRGEGIRTCASGLGATLDWIRVSAGP